MKTRLLLGLSLLFVLVFSRCQKENDYSVDEKHGNAKLKRILLYATLDDENPMSIVEEYEYDETDRISRVSSPMYEDGEITGTLRYDLYEYNSTGQLAFIRNFHANSNSPTGFINLKNYSYTYTANGNREKEYIEYPQANSFEYSLYTYENARLVRIEKYGNTNELESYVVNDYDDYGQLIKETCFAPDHNSYSYTEHVYSNGLNIKSYVYAGKYMERIREINRTYDENYNLIILESNELVWYSSMMSYVLRYEYFEE